MIDSILNLLETCSSSPENERALIQYGSGLANEDSDPLTVITRLTEFAQNANPATWPRHFMLLFSSVPKDRLQLWLRPTCAEAISQLYLICPADQVLRNQLLGMLLYCKGVDSWIELVCSAAPETADGIEIAFSPLVDTNPVEISIDQVQRLLKNGTDNRIMAAPIYELANREFREGRIQTHPAIDRMEPTCDLLGSLIQRLSLIEEGTLPPDATPESVAKIVQESVALIIALMDTMALAKYEPAVPKLKQALELKHRRIQVEAAAGLTRLDDDEGAEKLVELAEHPVVRPRVIAYAKELGIDDKISLELKGAISSAESVLALWLSQPEQMGLAPTAMKLLEQRELYWPSYEDPVACYLFQFEYGSGENAFKSVGISGPLTHAFTSDICHLSHADQFSAFAGWQTLTDEIFTVPIERAETVLAGELSKLKKQLEDQPIKDAKLAVLASFFGEYVLIAQGLHGLHDNQEGTLILGHDESSWVGNGNEQAPIDWQMAFDIWKGRKLLTNFNPAFS